jgi:Uncharacterised protein family (UPF0236)
MEASSQLEAVCDLSPMLNSIVQEFEGLVKQLWVFARCKPQADFSYLEEQARQLSRECFASALQTAAHLHRHSIEEGWLLGSNCCKCGRTPRYKGRQKRTLQTWVGSVTLERGYFHCAGCGSGRYPLDEALGIPGREQFSDGVQQGVCLLGVQMPFEGASEAMQMLSGISVSPRETERMTEQRGLALEEGLQVQSESQLLTTPTQTGSDSDGVWAVTLDAGKVRYEDGWHDAKAGVVYWAQPMFDEQGELEGGRATKQSYVAECGSMERAGERLSAEAWRRGIGPEDKVVCLGDGAPSNWVQFDEHFSNRVEVLDWYHACEHLWQVGNGIFGQGTAEAVRWVKQWENELWEGRVEAVIVALRRESKREGEAGEAAREQIHYFEANKDRMHYSEYRALGYPIGSGTVESACKRLIGARMKGAGMCWSKRGAQGVLTLRAELLSERWEQSWPKTRPLGKVA